MTEHHYVIAADEDSLDAGLFWSNKDGWVTITHADAFSEEDTLQLSPPVGGHWELLPTPPSDDHPNGTLAVKDGDTWIKLADEISVDKDGDLVLAQGSNMWVTIGNRSVLITHSDAGFDVTVYKLGHENDDPALDGMFHMFEEDD
jgi:hypothetical protein